MSVNKEKPHVFVLPEDDANRQIAVGFSQELDFSARRNLQILQPAGGWRKTVECFGSDHARLMARYPTRHLVLLIDLDNDPERAPRVQGEIPEPCRERVFILSTLTEPERLRSAGLGSFETIGARLASECREDTGTTWSHELLRHNAGELSRLREHVRPILFA